MSRPPTPLFLQRASYRQRRLRDAVKLMPVLGIILWALPIAWSTDNVAEQTNASSLLYVFGVWLLLIVLTAVLASRMRTDPVEESEDVPQQ